MPLICTQTVGLIELEESTAPVEVWEQLVSGEGKPDSRPPRYSRPANESEDPSQPGICRVVADGPQLLRDLEDLYAQMCTRLAR